MYLIFMIVIEIISLTTAASKVYAANKQNSISNSQDYIGQAQYEFQKGNYDNAIELYKKYLQKNKGQAQIINHLAAAYYHTGLPKKALRYFKKVQNLPLHRSYNLYYQGLCYLAIEDSEKAYQYFYYAAQSIDEYGSRATFELATIGYNQRDRKKSLYWLNLYLARYPTGVYSKLATQMVRSINDGTFIEGIEGNKKPDMENALFRYNPLSLYPTPHFWFGQIGYDFVSGAQYNPIANGGIREEGLASQAINANAGIGIGPMKSDNSTSFAGYTYRQRWVTEDDRVRTYIDDPTDLKYQPYRPDLLEREHQLYGDIRRKLISNMFLGLFGRMEFAQVGCNYCLLPDESEISKTLDISQTTLIIPWLGLSYYNNFQTLFYLYFRKEINKEAPEISNKTYSLFGDDNNILSYGVSHSMEFPAQKTSINLELFQYEFIYNDRYLDYTRLGAIAALEHEFISNFFINLLIGYYQDAYELRRLKQGRCNDNPTLPTESVESDLPIQCVRDDSGYLLQGGLYWNYTQFHRIAAYATYVQNQNPEQKVYNKTETKFLVMFTMAFPSVKRVLRYVDRFADAAFTKEVE